MSFRSPKTLYLVFPVERLPEVNEVLTSHGSGRFEVLNVPRGFVLTGETSRVVELRQALCRRGAVISGFDGQFVELPYPDDPR